MKRYRTSIMVWSDTKKLLDSTKLVPTETYDHVIQRLFSSTIDPREVMK